MLTTRLCARSLTVPCQRHFQNSARRTVPVDYLKYPTSQGRTVRLPLSKSPKVIGVAVSRGTRSYQEDAHSVSVIQLPPSELQESLRKTMSVHWDPQLANADFAGQLACIGIYDGHGGPKISQILQQELNSLIESVDKSEIADAIAWMKGLGGYFKRFKGGVLDEWVNEPPSTRDLDLEARVTLAFLQADRRVSQLGEAQSSGSTASVALLQSLDSTFAPFFTSQRLALTVAHCGDTRILLCSTDSGRVHRMTEDHHAETHLEATRLRRLGGSLVTDSFGEARWMGALANTRSIGDAPFKPSGVTPEPEVRTKLLEGAEWAYMVFVSDGVTSILSDEEIVDLARDAPDPQKAAQAILSFAEELGSEDNATVIVVPLAGWGTIRGPDGTKARRDYRREQALGSERQRRM